MPQAADSAVVSPRRALAIIGGCAALTLAVAACSTPAQTSAPRTTAIPSTNFVLLQVSTTTTLPAARQQAAGTVADLTSFLYVVQDGDTLIGIADKHDITFQQLIAANQWTDGLRHRLYPGDNIRIPGTAKLPTAGGAVVTNRCLTTYTITSSDTSRLKVAKRFKIDVAKLDQANIDTLGYAAFYPGLKINIPKC